MAVKDYFKVTRKTFFNPRAWLNYDEFKNQNRLLWNLVKDIVTVPPAAAPTAETFEQAIARHNMTEADIVETIKNYRYFTFIFIVLAFIAFVYAFFILFAYYTVTGWLLAMSVCALLLAQAFRYDFWSLQLRRRKLDLTFDDWKKSILGDKGGAA